MLDGHYLDPPPQENEWIADIALWCSWKYRGRCYAASHCEMLCLETQSFEAIMCSHSYSIELGRRYARQVVDYMNSIDEDLWTDFLRDQSFRMSARVSEGVDLSDE
eukprot:CAMPEP_0180545418 /NCGR_PEP_ID=MMETSP1036_2-20121128/70024_1 /TAXON_ID=632150 /ORGANISM="Azadinium spinosum, Strain 3D9" /LENGTH=105 /DNA_ID=CAMNT_0022560449 /DNA_START=397 /DNA_END=711 /DNA_ORIENTATION=-